MMQSERLKKNYEFSLVFRKGRFVGSRSVNLNYRKNRLSCNRVGVTTVRNIENAVQRNRVKRLLREAYRLLEPSLCTGYDLVFTGKPRNRHLQFADVLRDMRFVLRKAELLKEVGESQ
jgi:ribonuclease P protein component